MARDSFRLWASRYLPQISMLMFYFFTVVLGNLIYASPYGAEALELAGYSKSVLNLDRSFTLGYWVLLLMPFPLVPLVGWATRFVAVRYLAFEQIKVPEFSRIGYILLLSLCFAFASVQYWRAGVFELFGAGKSAVDSLEIRFFVLKAIGFPTQVVVLSLLNYLAIYPLIKALRVGGRFWWSMTALTAVFVPVFLILLNMKWPVLVFFMSLSYAVFVYASRWPYLKTIVSVILLVGAYLLISTWVFRLVASEPPQAASKVARGTQPDQAYIVPNLGKHLDDKPLSEKVLKHSRPSTNDRPSDNNQLPNNIHGEPEGIVANSALSRVVEIGDHAVRFAPQLLANAFSRMAIAFPYYYQVFSTEGPVCGGVIAQARIGPACRPSTLIYTRIFGDDGFRGRGTSPAAVHISAYALGGWPLAIFALIAASVILGLFSSLPIDAGATTGAMFIMGAIAGYHFSQVPGEGPIFYDHGFFWSMLMITTYFGCRSIKRIFARKNMEITA